MEVDSVATNVFDLQYFAHVSIGLRIDTFGISRECCGRPDNNCGREEFLLRVARNLPRLVCGPKGKERVSETC